MKDKIKKYSWLAWVVVIVLLVVGCVQMKKEAQQQRSDTERLCQNGVEAAWKEFQSFADTGEESYYYSGVAEFRAFMQTYYSLTWDTLSGYLYCNEVYGLMVNQPDKVKDNIQGLLEAMELLAVDYTDLNGYHKLRVFYNMVTK